MDIWTFVHEPKSLDEMVLSPDLREKLGKMLSEVPNMLLIGPPGVGKGTFVHILLENTQYDYIWINASDETGIDVMREKVRSFSTALGTSETKIVVLNECDSLTAGPQGAQKMLRQLMEDVQKITRFILLANYKKFIIPELMSRCQTVEMGNPPAKEIFKFVSDILSSENVKVSDKSIVVDIIKKMYPDIRQIVNTLQLNTVDGKLTSFDRSPTDQYKEILKSMKDGDLEEIRRTLRSSPISYNELYQYLFDNVGEFSSPGDMIVQIGEYLYKHNIVSIKEINFMAMVVYCIKKKFI